MLRLEDQGLKRLLANLLLVLVALCSWPTAARAGDPPLQISQYAHTSWTARDGAQLGLVFAMAQTADGYLWVAGSYGLFRFDGHQFQPWQPPDGQALPSGPYALQASRDGTLWIGTFSGLSSWNGRTFIRRHPEVGTRFVSSLLEARDGTVWVGIHGEPGRLCSVRAARIQCWGDDVGFGGFVWSLAEDRDGNLWVGADSGVWRWSPGAPQRHAMPGLRVGDLTTTAEGRILVGVSGGGLRQLQGGRLEPHRFRRAGKPDEWLAERDIKSNKLLRDRDGGLWIGTEGLGLLHVKDGLADSLTRAEGLSGNIACSLFEDREGNVWYGSERGIDRFRKLPVTTFSTRQGLPDDVVRSVLATRDGSLWVGTNDGLAQWKEERVVVYKEGDGLPHARVQSLHEDRKGRLWVSTAGGLAYLAGRRFVPVEAGPSSEIYAMAGDADGTLWLSGNKGLARLAGGRFVENLAWSALGRKEAAHVVIADRGGVWLSFWDGSGVSFFKDGKVEAAYAFAHLPGQGHVTDLRLDAQGAVWAATGTAGLGRIHDGHVAMLNMDNGLPCNTIHWTTLDDDGALWMYASCGLLRIGRQELASWIDDPARRVHAKSWGPADGVPLTVTPTGYFNPTVARRQGGKLWFVAGADLQSIDPANMPSNPWPPPVHILGLVADEKRYPPARGLTLPPMVRDIAIDFVALSLADPASTRFRYRLEGHDGAWQEAIDRRRATYTNLPPGNYRFRVTAANNSGVWNEEGEQLDFVIEPSFHQTLWFRVAAALLAALIAWGSFQLRLRMRIRRVQHQFEATLEARVAERTRIARDLHDTLLQHFNGLLLHLQAALNLLPDRPRESRQLLAAAIDRAAEAVTEGRDAVQGLRSAATPMDDYVDAVRALADDIAQEAGHPAAARTEVLGAPLDLQPQLREESLRIVGEALRNAFQHAAAEHIEIEILYDPRRLCVTVRDDGKGIDPEVLRSGQREGHFGLSGMRERAELVGASLTLRARSGGGTEVEFSAPRSRAYAGLTGAARWRLWSKWRR